MVASTIEVPQVNKKKSTPQQKQNPTLKNHSKKLYGGTDGNVSTSG